MAEDTEDKEELSMEDILSSIKDILMEDNAEQHKAAQKEEPAPQAAAPQPAPEVSRPAPAETVDDVLTLFALKIGRAEHFDRASSSRRQRLRKVPTL